MILKLIITAFLFILLIVLMYNATIAIIDHDDKFAALCAVGSGIVGIFFGLALGSFLI